MEADLLARIVEKLDHYQPSEQTRQLVAETSVLFLVGVSGAGKGSLRGRLVDLPYYHNLVSHTTRLPRKNGGVMEQDGREYHFITPEEAERMLDGRAFVEVKMYSGNIYGTSVAEIQTAHDQGKIAVTDIEVQGVAEYKAMIPSLRPVFVLPPDYDVWQRRFKARYDGALDVDDYRRRMQTARHELETALEAGYFLFVVNDDLDIVATIVDRFARKHEHDVGLEAVARATAERLYIELQKHQDAF